MPVSDAPWYRSLWFRWLLLAAGWVLVLISLPAPAFAGQTGWLPDPLPTGFLIVIIFLVPWLIPLWVSVLCFLLSPAE
jgi:hypothetical protein